MSTPEAGKSACPAWCERNDGTFHAIHTAEVAEFDLVDRSVTVYMEQPSNATEPEIVINFDTEDDSQFTHLNPALADSLGHVLTAMGDHPLGQALTKAVTLIGGVETIHLGGEDLFRFMFPDQPVPEHLAQATSGEER